MQIPVRQLADQWEKAVFWVTAALFAAVLLAWVLKLGAYRLQSTPSRDMPPAVAFLNPETAFAFTRELPPVALKKESPFNHEVRGRPKPKPPEPPPTATPPPVSPPLGATPSVAGVKTNPDQGKPKPPSKPPPLMRRFEYLGVMTATSGKVLALLRDVDSGSSTFVAETETLLGFKVKAYTRKSITLQDPKGTEVTVEYGQRRDFVVPE